MVEKQYADSLKTFIDSLLALGLVPEINFDTTKKFSNPEEMKQRLQEMQQQLLVFKQNNPTLTVSTTSPNINVTQTTPQIEQKEQNHELETEIKEVQPLKVQQLTQFTQNTVQNRGNLALEIIGSDGKTLASILPAEARHLQWVVKAV